MKRLTILLFLTSGPLLQVFAQPITYIWNMNDLNALRKTNNPTLAVYNNIITRSDSIIELSPIAVTDKQTSISGDKHNFESLSIYWWPDPKNPGGPYIARDGEYNPEYKQYDYPRLLKLRGILTYVSKAFFLTGDERYYNFFCRQLDTWFIDSETRMIPNFEYCQFVPGHNNGRGNPQGMVDAYNFNDVMESIRLVNSVKNIGSKRMKALKKWFRDFGAWMQTSEYGKKASNFKNNQAVAYDVTLYDMMIFTGKKSARKRILSNFYDKRVLPQIDDEGKMLEELRRTRGYNYSLFNLEHLIDFCQMVRSDGRVLPANMLSRVNLSLRYLQRFEGHKEAFPYREMGNWEEQESKLKQLSTRMRRLKLIQ